MDGLVHILLLIEVRKISRAALEMVTKIVWGSCISEQEETNGAAKCMTLTLVDFGIFPGTYNCRGFM